VLFICIGPRHALNRRDRGVGRAKEPADAGAAERINDNVPIVMSLAILPAAGHGLLAEFKRRSDLVTGDW
jgi:hypothetical protein